MTDGSVANFADLIDDIKEWSWLQSNCEGEIKIRS